MIAAIPSAIRLVCFDPYGMLFGRTAAKTTKVHTRIAKLALRVAVSRVLDPVPSCSASDATEYTQKACRNAVNMKSAKTRTDGSERPAKVAPIAIGQIITRSCFDGASVANASVGSLLRN